MSETPAAAAPCPWPKPHIHDCEGGVHGELSLPAASQDDKRLRERQLAYLRKFEWSDSTGEPVVVFAGTAEDLLDDVLRAALDREAGR